MCADEAANDRRKKIYAIQNTLVCALGGPNERAVRLSLRHLSGLGLSCDETRAVIDHLKKTAFSSALWPQHADLLYEWALDLNLAHGWNLEVADHRRSMHQWVTGTRLSSAQQD